MPGLLVQRRLLLSMGKRQLRGRLTVHCQTNLGHQVIFCRCGLGTSNWAGDIGVAHTELVIIPSVGAEILGFDLTLSIPGSSVVKGQWDTLRV